MQQLEPRLLTTSRVEAQGQPLSRLSRAKPRIKPARALASPCLRRIHAVTAERAVEGATEVTP
jgi:hypothetical protein